jgi:hypothetical protein
MKRSFIVISLCTAMLVLVGCSQMLVSGQSDDSKSPGIVGVWRTAVSPRNCETGAPLGPVFPGILLFEQGGTMTGTSTSVTSTYGTWTREAGQRQYSFATLSFRYDAAGVLIGTRKITQNVTIDDSGNGFTSSGHFEDRSIANEVTASGCSSATGTRF